jgi:hypothetical protein
MQALMIFIVIEVVRLLGQTYVLPSQGYSQFAWMESIAQRTWTKYIELSCEYATQGTSSRNQHSAVLV